VLESWVHARLEFEKPTSSSQRNNVIIRKRNLDMNIWLILDFLEGGDHPNRQ